MTPYYEDAFVTIYHGDCRDVLPTLEPVETCLTDPPYGLSFMGRDWDHGVPGEAFWSLVKDALLPGAMCLAFGGTRTFHRLTCAIEDAGFEVRDCIMYLYGAGFPKSLDISKAIDKAAGAEREVVGTIPDRWAGKGNVLQRSLQAEAEAVNLTLPATDEARQWHGWGTALKPAYEPIVLAMKPLEGTFAENALERGVAGLNIDGCRIGTDGRPHIVGHGEDSPGKNTYGSNGPGGGSHSQGTTMQGRWPANVILDEDSARLLDEQSGELSGRGNNGPHRQGSTPGQNTYGTYRERKADYSHLKDSGGASRFFYTSKASRADRGPGNDHPTVKPSDLMKWLVKLTATPTGGTVLDPFMGSGTTLYAAKEMGRKAIGIELEERYCEIAASRLAQGVLPLEAS